MKAKSKLHEIIAVEPDLDGETKRILAEGMDTFSKRDRFTGGTKSLVMFDDSRANENTTESKEVTTTVADKLAYVQDAVIRYYDAYLQKEATNQKAKADLVVNDVVILKDVPATALLGLETKLKSIRALYESIPTLAPGVKWVSDEAQGKGVFREEQEKITSKTEKSIEYKVLVAATDKHPAQVEKWNVDKAVGKYVSVNYCSMMTVSEKSKLIGRIDTLIRAAKQARQRANEQEVDFRNMGKAIFEFIHGE